MGLTWYLDIAGEWDPPVEPPKIGPDGKLKKPKKPQWLPIVLDRKEVHELLEAPGLSGTERLLLRVLYSSGMWAEELVLLDKTALDAGNRALQTKNRAVVVDSETFQALSELDWSEWQWTVEKIQGVLDRAAATCQVGERYRAVGRVLLPKALRHAYGSHCLENGIDLYSLHKLIGNKYVDTTEILLILAVGRWRQKYDACHPLAGQHALGGNEQCHLSLAEVQEMMQDALKFSGQRDYLILRLMYASGMRVSEVVNLVFADMHYGEGRVFVRQAKGKKDRYVLIDRESVELVKEWQAGRPLKTPLFDIQERQMQNVVKDIGERTGLLGKYKSQGYSLSPHSFRHAFATHLYKNGMDSVAIEKLLGHVDLETTFDEYVECDLAHWKAAYMKGHDLVKRPPGGPGRGGLQWSR